MKKTYALFLAICLAVCVITAGCAKNENNEAPEETPKANTVEALENDEPDESTDE